MPVAIRNSFYETVSTSPLVDGFPQNFRPRSHRDHCTLLTVMEYCTIDVVIAVFSFFSI